MTRLTNPKPYFHDALGYLLDAGFIYIGAVNTDPTIVGNQLPLFWDAAMTKAAPQPLRTLGGRVMNGQTPSDVYFAALDYSQTVTDLNGVLISYDASAIGTGTSSYQPLDADLTTISGQTNTAFGLALLELADQPSLQSEVGIGSAGLLAKATSAQFRNNTSNVVLTPDVVWGAAGYVPLTPGATVSLDLSTGFNFTLAMSGNYTLANPTNGKTGQSGKILITQDATGNRTLAYGAAYKVAGGVAPALTTTANASDILFYEVMPSGNLFVSLAKNVS